MGIHPVYYLLNYIMLAANITITLLCFGRRRRITPPVLLCLAALLVFNLAVYFHPATARVFEKVPVSLLWFALLSYLNGGTFFSKSFIYFGAFYISLFLYVMCSFGAELAFGYESGGYFAALTVSLIALMLGYVAVVWRYGRAICERLFTFSRPAEWAVYMAVPVASLVVIGYLYMTQGVIWHPVPMRRDPVFLLLPVFMMACVAFIIIAIVNTHEKTQKKYEAEFAQNVIATGREHYEKLRELQETISILRHDYKHHLSAMGELASAGDIEGIRRHLAHVGAALPEGELAAYTDNAVLNALLSSYRERCERQHTGFDVRLALPAQHPIPTYELCIIFGNLLENAMEASARLGEGRNIELSVKTQGRQLAIMVRNRFDGAVETERGQPVSRKPGGGYGLRSVRAVAQRHDGHILTEWDEATFTTYVMLRM